MVTVGVCKGKSSLNDHYYVGYAIMLVKGIYLEFPKALGGSTFGVHIIFNGKVLLHLLGMQPL